MKVCKVKPDSSVCSGCYDTAIMFGGKISCKDCNKEEYELIETHCSLWTSYAVIVKKGKLQKVPMDRIYDVRDVSEEKGIGV